MFSAVTKYQNILTGGRPFIVYPAASEFCGELATRFDSWALRIERQDPGREQYQHDESHDTGFGANGSPGQPRRSLDAGIQQMPSTLSPAIVDAKEERHPPVVTRMKADSQPKVASASQ